MSLMTDASTSALATSSPVIRLARHASERSDTPGLYFKELGLWHAVTFREYHSHAIDVAHALLVMGIGVGDRVAVHSENRPEWAYADFGIQAIRAICVGLYPTNPAAEVAYLLRDSGARVLIAEDQEQVDKVLEVDASELPDLTVIVYIDAQGVNTYNDPRLMSWDDFIATGREHRQSNSGAVEAVTAEARVDDVAVMIYTSGTTGPPKGAMISIRNIEFAIGEANGPGGLITPPAGPDDLYVSYLPLCHVYERLLTCWLSMASATPVYFAESVANLQVDLREVQPTVFVAVPRILEKMYAGVNVRMSAASKIKQANYGIWSKVAGRIGETLRETGGQHTPMTRVLYAIGWVFLFRALKERLGLRHCRIAVSGAAPIAPEILLWFMGIGVPMAEGYGMTENTAIATANRLDDFKLGTVGTPYPGVELKLAEGTNEILTRHDGTFVGYWNKPEKTAETLTADGWLMTGDVGEWVDGKYLKIVDRMKDIIITSGGKNISPSEIENSLKTSPFIGEAIVVGDGRKYLTALIGIDPDVVGAWAQSKDLAYTTYRDITEKIDVIELIAREVEKTNAKFSSVEGIKHFRLLPKLLDHEDGEVTATQKIKRSAIAQIYADLIDGMYKSKGAAA